MTQQNVLRALPTEPGERKTFPIVSGVLDYFPLAIAAIARVSKQGNDQHNPGQPLHWARDKSKDHADCIARHLIERGTIDADGMRHTAKAAWRALALLQEELEQEAGYKPQTTDAAVNRPIMNRLPGTDMRDLGTTIKKLVEDCEVKPRYVHVPYVHVPQPYQLPTPVVSPGQPYYPAVGPITCDKTDPNYTPYPSNNDVHG